MRDLSEIQWRDLMNQDPPTHWVLILSCDVFVNIFLVKLFIFIWNTVDYFCIVKVVEAPLQQVKIFHITAPWHHRIHPLSCHNRFWCCLGNYVTSQWIGDVAIDTKLSCDKQPGSFIQDPGTPGSFTQYPGGGKHGYFNSKTESSYTSQDKLTNSLTHSLTHILTCSLTHSLSFAHSLIHSLAH